MQTMRSSHDRKLSVAAMTLAAVAASGHGLQAQVKKPAPAPPAKPAAPAKPAPPVAKPATTPAPGQRGGVGQTPQRPVPTPVPVGQQKPPFAGGPRPPAAVPVAHTGPAPKAGTSSFPRPQPLAAGVHSRPDGGSIHVDPRGNQTVFNRNNKLEAVHRDGFDAHYGPTGRPDMVHVERPGGFVQTVHRGPGGGRVVDTYRPAFGGRGEEHVVSMGPGRGWVDRPMGPGHEGYLRHTAFRNGVPYASVYRGYHYGRFDYYRPVPAYVYAPAYYGWAVRPWGPAVAIQLGYANPYMVSFQPYAAYASPDQWMTDQILAQNMQAAYDAGRAAGTQAGGPDMAGYAPAAPPVISPQLKQQFDAQVQQEVKEQSQEAAAGPDGLAPPVVPGEPDRLPDVLKPTHTVFRVVSSLTVDSEGQSCTLSTNDWIVRSGGQDDDGMVDVRVAATNPTDCAQGAPVKIALNDLMTMENEENQQVQNALLLASQTMGTKGMPVGPASGQIPVPGGKTSPDLTVAQTLQQEQTQGAAAEQQALAVGSGGQ